MDDKRTKLYSFLAIIITCTLASEYYRSITTTYNWEPTHFNPKEQNILVLGDSISMGYTPKLTELLSRQINIIRPLHKAYSFIPIAYTTFTFDFSRKSPLIGLPKINIHIDIEHGRALNCGGTLNATQKIEKWIDNKYYDIIHMNFGIWDTKNLDRYEYHNNIEEVILKVKPHASSIILATTTPVDDKDKNNKIIQFNNSIIILAKKHNATVNDLYNTVINNSLLRVDGTHYNDDGYTVLAQATEKILRTNLLQDVTLLPPNTPTKNRSSLTSNRTHNEHNQNNYIHQ